MGCILVLEVEQEGDMVTVVAVVSAIISVVIGMSVIAVCYCEYRRLSVFVANKLSCCLLFDIQVAYYNTMDYHNCQKPR